jgi:heptaprenylglyceryl phosphate synthase
MARWTDPAEMSAFQLTLYKKAICSQTDFLAVNGLDSVTGSRSDNGFTVGKVHVNGRAGSEQKSATGAMAGNISPMAALYLEQSGLMNPAMPVVGGCVC